MVDISNVNISNLSISELTELEEKIKAAKMVPTGMRLVALTIALKETVAAIKEIEPDVLPEQIGSITPQAMPKHNVIAKRYGLSETQAKNAQDKASKAIAGL